MTKELKLTLNGKSYDVEVGDVNSSPVSVVVNGKEYQVEVEFSGSAPVVTPAAMPVAASTPVSAPVKKPVVTAAPSGAGGDAIVSPMPGVILDIMVKVGDKVTRGQQICALEAMKMKSAIRSPKDAVVTSVEVTDGQKVPHGAVIIRLG
ncbi:MAG TPA: biotin/lipoyl-containing protein [Longilinea sp.]|nr:biotin/lipoyl-containing protein [Longilinea sp.]